MVTGETYGWLSSLPSLLLSVSLPVSLSVLLPVPVPLPLGLLRSKLETILSLLPGVLLLCFCPTNAMRRATRVAAAARRRIGEGPCCSPQSTLQRQGAGLIWASCCLMSWGTAVPLGYLVVENLMAI